MTITMTVATKKHRPLPTSYQLKEYRILSIIGEGDFGITYFAQDTKRNRKVAIKEYFPRDLAEREESYEILPHSEHEKNYAWGLGQFVQEGYKLANFRHPNIVRVLHYFEWYNTAYIIMEYEQGQSLASILKSSETLTEAEIIEFLPPLLEGLQAVHEAGFLHQDIKPDSIYLRDKDHSPVLLDFGAARYALGHLRRDVSTIITPGYAPFEQYQIKGSQSYWTDIYALGAVLYHTVGGTPVEFMERIDAIKRRKESDPLVPAVEIGGKHYSVQLLQGIDWALQLAEEDRPQTVQMWAKTLVPKSHAWNLHLPVKPHSVNGHHQWVLAGLIVAMIVLSVGYIFYTEQRLSELQQQQRFNAQRVQQQSAAEKSALQLKLDKTQQQAEELLSATKTQQQQLAQLQSEKAGLQHILGRTQWQLEESQKARSEPSAIIRDRLRNGYLGPEMVVMAAGRFRIGDIQGQGNNNEQPVHWVTVENHFAIGRYEVTFAEYDRFADATGRKKPNDEDWGRGHRPVINVSWYDAAAYAEWLSQETGHQYRLPTEVEWEYAARAGTMTQYWWGDQIELNLAHCNGCSQERKTTAPIGSFAPNPFGLYDMMGNVREWTCSEYEERYRGKAQLCITRQTSSNYRVERGGSWTHSPTDMRVSSRYKGLPKARSVNVGFRVVRID